MAKAHDREPDIRNECHLLAHRSRKELAEIQDLIDRYGEAKEAERLGNAVEPRGKATAFGLVRDLHDCWLLAMESHTAPQVLTVPE